MAAGGAREARGSDSLTRVRAAARLLRRCAVHFTPYWKLADGGGCVARAPETGRGYRRRQPGTAAIVIGFSLARVFAHGPRCT